MRDKGNKEDSLEIPLAPAYSTPNVIQKGRNKRNRSSFHGEKPLTENAILRVGYQSSRERNREKLHSDE